MVVVENDIVNYFVWIRITDEGSVSEMRIWSILSIKSDLKWCIHLSRSLFVYSNRIFVLIANKRRVKILEILRDFRCDSMIPENVGNIKQVHMGSRFNINLFK